MFRCLALLALAGAPVCAGGLFDLDGKPIDEYTFAIEGRAWRAELNGDTEVDEEDFEGDEVDLEEDLDLDNDRLAGEGLVRIRLKRFRIEGRFFQQEFDGENVLEQSFRFDGDTFVTFEEVEGEITVRSGGVDVEYIVIDIGEEKAVGFELGAGIGARYLFAEAAIKRTTGGRRAHEDSDTVVPVVRLSAEVFIANCLSFAADAEAMHIRFRDVTTTFGDVTAQVKLFLHHHAYLALGYRYVAIELEDRGSSNDFDIELATQGWFAGLCLQF